MRLVTRELWRAFPELDRFDDAQCRRFVAAAGRGLVQRAARWVAVALAVALGVTLIPGLLILEAAAVRWGWMLKSHVGPALQRPAWMNDTVYAGIGLVLVFGLGGFLGVVTRDIALRWRVRRVLKTRGRCAGCNYFLGGLPVGEDLRVVCPECGFETEVDESLGELRMGADGAAARFEPSEQTIQASNPWLTAAFVRRWSKRIGIVLGAIVVVAGSVAGWHEWRIRRQAARAAELKPGPGALMALIEREEERLRPVAAPDQDKETNAFELLTPILRKMGQAEVAVYPKGPPQTEGPSVSLDGTWIAARAEPGESETVVREREASEPHSTRVLAEFERVGVFDDARAMANAERAVSALNVPPGTPLAAATWSSNYAAIRKLARWEGARMRLAARADDPAAFAEAMDNTLGYAAMLDRQPVLIARLVGLAVESLAYSELRAALRTRNDARWLDALERVWKKRERHASRELPFEGGKVVARDTVCWIFVDPHASRLGRNSPGLAGKLGVLGGTVPEEGRLGTLDENLAVVDAYYDALIADASLPRTQRSGAADKIWVGDSMLQQQMLTGISKALNSQDQTEIDRAATPVLFAVERFRLANDGYPKSLVELTPRFLPSLPVDPWTGKAFGYKLLDPKVDPQGRAFLLYGFGSDGVDDGGKAPQYWWEALHGAYIMGTDFIVNDSAR